MANESVIVPEVAGAGGGQAAGAPPVSTPAATPASPPAASAPAKEADPFESRLKAERAKWERENSAFQKILGNDEEVVKLRKELEEANGYKAKYEELTTKQKAELAAAFEKDLVAKYEDILGHESDEPNEVFIALVEKGIDVDLAAKVVRTQYNIGTQTPAATAPAAPAAPAKPGYTRTAAAVSTGDTTPARTPQRRGGNILDLIEASAEAAFTKKA
jgi:hypothetical protein